jgi:hypothetical protein
MPVLRRHVTALLIAAPLLLTAAACGSSTTPSTGGSGVVSGCSGAHASGSMTAQINGTAWTAVCISASSFTGNVLSLGGSDNATNATVAQIIAMATTATGPGTFPIGPLPITNGANGLLTINAQIWSASATQGSGTITITTLNSTGTSGTFSFNLVAVPPATGTKTITNGTFNITF